MYHAIKRAVRPILKSTIAASVVIAITMPLRAATPACGDHTSTCTSVCQPAAAGATLNAKDNTVILGNLGLGVAEPKYRLELPNTSNMAGQARANSWQTYSSIRWKEHVTPIKDALTSVSKLQGVFYDWKPEYGGQHDIGFIAEEVGKVVPELVNWEIPGEAALGLKYDRIPALTVEAIKEQEAVIEQQQEFLLTLQQQLLQQEQLINDQQKQIDSHRDLLTQHTNQLNSHESSITLLKTENVQMKQDIAQLKKEVAELKAMVGALQAAR